MPAIETHELHHAYRRNAWSPRIEALRGLDLAVEAGEVFGYLGANGAGKTTTIKILVGLLHPTRGTARLFGKDSREAESRRAVGFQPENPYFYEYLTADESLRFYAALAGVPRRERAARSGELLEFVGLADAARVRVKAFSKGMRQRLGIAQALVHRPRLVILDEPMSGLDPVGRLQVREAILELRRQGLTVFFSSHVLADVELVCDRVGLLDGGRLQDSGPLGTLLERETKRIEVGVAGGTGLLREQLKTAAAAYREEGDLLVLAFGAEAEAQEAIRLAAEESATVRFVQPVRETLEEYFMRRTGRSRAEVGAWSGGADR
jgi:ABC-2 type transport system ATP-binding protein